MTAVTGARLSYRVSGGVRARRRMHAPCFYIPTGTLTMMRESVSSSRSEQARTGSWDDVLPKHE